MGDPAADQPSGTLGGKRRPLNRGWRIVLASALTGAAGGIAVYDFSGTLGYRGLAGVFVLATVLATAIWLRTLDPGAPLARHAPWLFLAPAAADAIIAAFSPEHTAAIFTAIAVILTAGAVFLSTEIEVAAYLLAVVADIGVGATVLAGGNTLAGAALTVFGTAFIGLGAARLTRWAARGVVAFIGVGTAFIGVGAAELAGGNTLAGAALTGLGVMVIGVGAAVLADRDTLAGVALIGGGAADIGLGATVLAGGNTLARAAFTGLGVMVIGVAAADIGPFEIASAVRRLADSATKPLRDT